MEADDSTESILNMDWWTTMLLTLGILLAAAFAYSTLSAPAVSKRTAESEPEPVPAGLPDALKKAGAVLYGAEWCGFTKKQMKVCEPYMSSLTYVDCVKDKDKCKTDGVSAFPTWVINGKKHEGFMSNSRLQELLT